MTKFRSYKIEFFLARSFSLGIMISSPSLNGLYFEVMMGCFWLRVRSRGQYWLGFSNYWGG